MATGMSRRIAAALLLAALVAAAGHDAATASLSASLQELIMPASPYSHKAQTITGRTVLTVTDSSIAGTGVGWNVTEQASDLAYSGPNNGASIPASALAILSVETPVASSGSQPVNPANGPMVPTVAPVGSLDGARMVLQANSGYGAGTYTQGITLSLTIPAQSRAGTYTSTFTTTITSGP